MKELDLNVGVDVAFLAAQTPPIRVFPSPITSKLPYNDQVAALESDYIRYYSYRGDLKYNENMKRSFSKMENGKSGETCLYRVCRDKNRFFESRIKDDVRILAKILESMAERTAEMEKHLENVLLQNGEKELPNWTELYAELKKKSTDPKKSDAAEVVAEKTSKKGSASARKSKDRRIAQNAIASTSQKNGQNQREVLTHDGAQKLVAKMMLNRTHLNAAQLEALIGLDGLFDESTVNQQQN